MSTEFRMSGAAVNRVPAWTVHLSVLGVLIVALLALNWAAVVAAVIVWWVSPTFSHCFLIIPVSAYLIWGRRRELAAMTPVAYPRALLLALPLIATSFVGALASINEIEQFSLIGLVQVLALAVLGPAVYRKILFPSLFLFFLVPMGEYLIGPLQRFTTWFIDHGLTILGILHYTEGNLIELPSGAFQVAEACAGLRFLIATIAVGVLFAHFTYRKWHKIALFLLACVIVPIIGNGFRALGIVLLAHFSDNTIAVGADHLVYGWLFSVLILAVLLLVGVRFADRFPEEKPAPAAAVVPPPHLLTVTIAAALVSIAAVPAFHFWQTRSVKDFDGAAFTAPPAVQGWATAPVSRDWSPGYRGADASLAFALRDTDRFAPPVDVFVDYYAAAREGHDLISSSNKLWDEDVWHPVVQDQIAVPFAGRPVRFGELEIAGPGLTRLVWWTYASGGGFTTSGLAVKLNRVKAALTGKGGSALVVVSTQVDVDLDTARARLREALGSLGDLEHRIDSAAAR